MPTNITDSNTWTTPLVAPSDGDAVTGASIQTPVQGVGNRTEFLRKRILGTETGDIISLPLNQFFVAASGGAFKWTASLGAAAEAGWQQNDVGAAYSLGFPVPLPKHCVIKSVTAAIRGASGHAGLPGTMPVLRLLQQDPSGGNAAVIGSQTDASPNVPSYEVTHLVTISGLSQAVAFDELYNYYVLLHGEGGANAAIGLFLFYIAVTIDPA